MTTVDIGKLTADLRRDEGVVPHAYQDSLGFWTIGVGRLIDKRKGGKLAPDEIDYLLKNDIVSHARELEDRLPWLATLDEVRQRALVNMAFQLGVTGLLSFTNTLALIKDGKYAEAAANALKSQWAQQTPERARRVAKIIETGVG